MRSAPVRAFCGQRHPQRSPEGIRTLATALRGRRPRPLDDGARTCFLLPIELGKRAELYQKSSSTHPDGIGSAGVPGLEPRLTGPEPVGLPITPYPIQHGLPRREETLPDPMVSTKSGYRPAFT